MDEQISRSKRRLAEDVDEGQHEQLHPDADEEHEPAEQMIADPEADVEMKFVIMMHMRPMTMNKPAEQLRKWKRTMRMTGTR